MRCTTAICVRVDSPRRIKRKKDTQTRENWAASLCRGASRGLPSAAVARLRRPAGVPHPRPLWRPPRCSRCTAPVGLASSVVGPRWPFAFVWNVNGFFHAAWPESHWMSFPRHARDGLIGTSELVERAREHLTAAWGSRRRGYRIVCGVCGPRVGEQARLLAGDKILTWTSAADMATMRHMIGGSVRQWSCRRHRIPRLRFEAPSLKLAGTDWWGKVGSWPPWTVACGMWQEASGGDDAPPASSHHQLRTILRRSSLMEQHGLQHGVVARRRG